jgi:DUF4097 and DUF4098 domain-containing protein YvlB
LSAAREADSETGDVSVHFTVRLPAGVKARFETVNGAVSVAGASAEVRATTVNGNVVVSGPGPVSASTVNGSVEAVIESGADSGDIELRTVNGSVSATAPAGINANLSASTVTGDIQSDFPLTVQGRFGPRRVSGTLGNGGRSINLNTVNGSITLRRN